MRNPTCREILSLMTEYLEGALEPATRDLVERHLAICEGCDAYLDQLRTTIQVTGALHEEQVPAPVMESLLEAFRGWRGE